MEQYHYSLVGISAVLSTAYGQTLNEALGQLFKGESPKVLHSFRFMAVVSDGNNTYGVTWHPVCPKCLEPGHGYLTCDKH